MYFEIENTPEQVKRARRTEIVEVSPKEECPLLKLAPFSRPPQVIFEDVLIGTTCEKHLEILNPSKQLQKITLGRALPPGLEIHLPGDYLLLEPDSSYYLTLLWTPMQLTALRETIRFMNDDRGRYDVIVVLKSVMTVKGKGKKIKGLKISPGKIKKKALKKSPVAIYKKMSENIYNTSKIKTVNVVQTTSQYKVKTSNKENVVINDEYSTCQSNNPFDSSSIIETNFNTSEIFPNVKFIHNNEHQRTYDKLHSNKLTEPATPHNVLKPSNRQLCDNSVSDIFDDLTFTPLKFVYNKDENLNKVPKISVSMHHESNQDRFSIKKSNKENDTHSIISISKQSAEKWLTVTHTTQHLTQNLDSQLIETPNIDNKKIPNTSSPKELNSPNFSINTEFSRISDLSFFPQRYSTEKKVFAKVNNETHEIIDDMNCNINNVMSSNTYTKDSPNTPMEHPLNQMYVELKPPHYFTREPKMCRQNLFKEYQQMQMQQKEAFDRDYVNAHRFERHVSPLRSPPRSLTPPLQSIPEESTQYSYSHTFDKTNNEMATFTINRTFDKPHDRSSTSNNNNNRQSWSKKAIRTETELWKIPMSHAKKSSKPKLNIGKTDNSLCGKINITLEGNKNINQNTSLNQVGNVYSQSFTIDPFLSSTYFYDEQAVDSFEKEFKKWLNYILTPPADLDSNVEEKVDIGKAWLENRNKEVPAAPTKEQVCSAYHNNHRLESLRKAAKTLLLSSEIGEVFLKLNVQIEKKLIAIRADKNLHLDIGLQKIIMEILLSYNPLWLRIGLEAIYDQILPLKSNNDIEGLTAFIIQRMFRNPYLKNKNSKSNAPNVLLPAYMEAIKKFTLKKFFMLVFFLDQAKQKKLIPHDPCLFCRIAVCKESREIIIRFTRELIAGIGDITRHLRPLGYVVSHKQSYLDEYKYAVHNIAVDIRDGVRLTKVMEIILMKNGLLQQLRTPAISRLQKIHNVQVALNALKEANFVIAGDITATDIADGHREKTLSLLWQLIHVFRAPLFVKAANVIQVWWRKKCLGKRVLRLVRIYKISVLKIEEWYLSRKKIQQAKSILYKLQLEREEKKITSATLIQSYIRGWLCLREFRQKVKKIVLIQSVIRCFLARKRYLQLQKSARYVQQKYTSKLLMKQEMLRFNEIRKSTIVIQSYIRRWLCMKKYKMQLQKIVFIQSIVRGFLVKKWYQQLKKSVICIQQKYRSRLLMKQDMQLFVEIKTSVVVIQSYFKMMKQYKYYQKLKNSIKIIEIRYSALIKMRQDRTRYLELKNSTILVQKLFRGRKVYLEYKKNRNVIIKLQRNFRANREMKKERENFLQIKKAVIVLQNTLRSYVAMKKTRQAYVAQRKSAIQIQRYYRSYLLVKRQRNYYLELLKATIVLQKHYRSLLEIRKARSDFLKIKNAVLIVQRQYRAQILMKFHKLNYDKLRTATINVQSRFRAQMQMRKARSDYLKYKFSCVKIQNAYRAYMLGKQQRQIYLKEKRAAVAIQKWFRNCKKGKVLKQQYAQSKQACVLIQRTYRAYIIGRKHKQEYIKIRTATICIQKYYRAYVEMKTIRQQYIQLKAATVTIQRLYRGHLETVKYRNAYLQRKTAATTIQNYYRSYRESKKTRQRYCHLRKLTIYVQRKYRSMCITRKDREKYLKIKLSAIAIQQRFRALLAMRKQRQDFLNFRAAVVVIQNRFRAQSLSKKERIKYLYMISACITIQRFYRAYITGKIQRQRYLTLRYSVVVIQQRYRALIIMRTVRKFYLKHLSAVVIIQRRYRAYNLMLEQRTKYIKTLNACLTIQRKYRAYSAGRHQRAEYLRIKHFVILIQRGFRAIRETRAIRSQYTHLRNAVLFTQRRFRANRITRERRQNEAAQKIQRWYTSINKRNECRILYLDTRKKIIILQSMFRMFILRKRYIVTKNAVLTIQRFYRAYKLCLNEKQKYSHIRMSVIKLQAYVRGLIQRKRYIKIRSAVLIIQTTYRLKKQRDQIRKEKETRAVVCIQKNVRRYLVQSRYQCYKNRVIFVQRIWKGKLLTRLARWEYLQKKKIVIKLQAIIRGYLVRKLVQDKKENLVKSREVKRRHWAATKIQALFRGHSVRVSAACDKRAAELRKRWRNGGLKSTEETMRTRNEKSMEVLRNMADIETVIRAFRSLELLTEVFPTIYNNNASSVVRRVYIYMSVTNRSISSIELLKYAASLLVNLTRYKITGPKIYSRDRISPILKFMLRFSTSEIHLFCIFATYLWLFSKYDGIRQDLTEYLHIHENHKMLVTMKGNVDRMERMASNAMKNKFHTPLSSKSISHTKRSMRDNNLNFSVCSSSSNCSDLLPALEPDYGIIRANKPRYFESAQHAMNCLFHTYKL